MQIRQYVCSSVRIITYLWYQFNGFNAPLGTYCSLQLITGVAQSSSLHHCCTLTQPGQELPPECMSTSNLNDEDTSYSIIMLWKILITMNSILVAELSTVRVFKFEGLKFRGLKR